METIPLGLKDRKILFELSLNARETTSNIAKRLSLSKQVVKYRLERMEKAGIIEGYYAILNINRLGYLYHRVFFKFRNVSPEKEEKLIAFCRAHKSIGWIFQLYGDWDFAIAIWARDAVKLEEVLHEILDRFGEYFEDKLISVSTTIHHLKCRLLLDRKDTSELVMGGPVRVPELDEADYCLLGILAKNARMSLLELGRELGVNPKVVRYRINRLMKQRIILGFNVKLNYGALGYTHQKIFLNLTNFSHERTQKLIAYIRSLPTCIYITHAVGVADLEFELLVSSDKELNDMMRDMRYRFSNVVRNYFSFIIYHEPYINYLPMRK